MKEKTGAGSPVRRDVAVAERPEAEPFGWFGDWFGHFPSMFTPRFPEFLTNLGVGPNTMRVEQYFDDGMLVIHGEIPGVDPDEDIEISISGGKLTIDATRERHEETEDESGYRSEFQYGSYRRTMALPARADTEHVRATYDDGILEIRVPVDEVDEPEATKVPVTHKG